MFNSFEQIKWGGGSEGRGGGGIGISAFRSNRFALWLLSNSIFCQLASRTPTREKKTRTTRAIYTLHSITHVSARAKGAHIDSHTVTNMARKLLCVFFYIFFFVCCFCISFGRHSIDIYPGRFSDTMRVHLFAQFVCSPSILCLCAHKHKSASAPLLSLEKVPFHLFPPTCLKRRGGEGLGYRNPPDRFKIHTKHCNDGVNRV